VSLLSKKRPVDDVVDVRGRALQSVQRAVPAAKNAIPRAKQAVPAAKDAGLAVKEASTAVSTAVLRSAEDATAWARPRVDDAAAWARPWVDEGRSWAAPKLERSGMAVQETIAPAIADAMVSAARAIDVKTPPRRRWAKPAAITMIVAAIASAAAAIAIRRRPPAPEFPPVDPDSPVDPAFGEASSTQAESDVDGRLEP
jgi:hypothetical protein